MIQMTFNLPTLQPAKDNFEFFITSVLKEKTNIEHAIERNQPLGGPLSIDKPVWDDLVNVLADIIKPPINPSPSEDWTIWSLHREKPSWGAPLLDLSASELDDSVSLTFKTSLGHTDAISPQFVVLKCINPFSSLKPVWSAIEELEGINYWVLLRNNSVLVTLDEYNKKP